MKKRLTSIILISLFAVFHMESVDGDKKRYLDLDDPEYVPFISEAALENIDIHENREELQNLLTGQNSLQEALSPDSPAKTRQLGVLVLGASSPRRGSYISVIRFFSDPSDEVKAQAARVMRFMGRGQRSDEIESPTWEATNAIVDLWDDPSPKVRKEAVGSFFRFGSNELANHSWQLKKLLKVIESDSDLDVKMEGISVFRHLVPAYGGNFANGYVSQYTKLLNIGMSDPDIRIKEATVGALIELRDWPYQHNSRTSGLVKRINKAQQKLDAEKDQPAGNVSEKGSGGILGCFKKWL